MIRSSTIVLALILAAGCGDSSYAPSTDPAGAPPPSSTDAPATTTSPAPGDGTVAQGPATFTRDTGLEGAPFTLKDPACKTSATQTFCQSVVYSVVDQQSLHLDLYAPPAASTKKVPVIVYVHGGGWAHGSYHGPGIDTDYYLSKGYAIMSVEYRLTLANNQPTGLTFPENLRDVKTAIRWIRMKASSVLDGQKIVAYGFSAGAHLVSLLATTSKVAKFDGRGDPTVPVSVSGAVMLSAAFDFHVFVPDNPPLAPECDGLNEEPDPNKPQLLIPLLIGGDINDPANAPKLDEMDSSRYADADTAPMITFNGTCDQTQPYQSTETLKAAITSKGLTQIDVNIVPMAVHGGTLAGTAEKTKVQTFIDRWLGP